MSVVIETSIGDIVIDLYVDERPNCCKNFLKLCKIKYYHYSLFYSVQKNYVAQTGDPTGTGRGGESIFSFVYGDQAKFFEMERFPKIKHRKLGCVSMINNGNDMHGSQFMITLTSDLDYLDGKHTVFGEVAKGFDVLEKLNDWICDKEGRPYQDIRITHTVILEDPYEDFKQLSIENSRASPEPTDERLASDRIRVDEEVDQLEGMTEQEIEKYIREKEARTRAKLLEIIGDIPDADIKPPENVLFVCKLNPVTTDEDLELIFSRFGKINSCEVIRDRKTGDSLCYAFIEFDKEEDCENAYFKMDNVLIDDRRIHVDFSQSVAKVNWKGKGTGTGYFEDNTNFKSSGKPELPKKEYNVKLKTNYQKRDDRYGLVFDEEESESVDKKYEPVNRYKNGNRDRQNEKNSDRYSSSRDKDRDSKYHYDKYKDSDRDRDRERDRDRHRDKYSHQRDKDRERRDDKRDKHSNDVDYDKRKKEYESNRDREKRKYESHHKSSSHRY